MRWPLPVGVLLLLLAAAAVLIWRPWSDPAPFRFFAATSFWNQPLPAGAPVDPTSGALVAHLAAEVAVEERDHQGPYINTSSYSVPIYTVPAGQPLIPVHLDRTDPALAAAFRAVPLPPAARPASGTDGSLVVWQPSSDRMWEFWQLHRTADGWHASWGGAMRGVQHSDGIFGPSSWPGAESFWGAAASSLPLAGGLMTLEQLRRGTIDHALALAVPDPRAGVWSWPAQRTDGHSTDPTSLPEGTRLRLDPRLDLSSLHLPRLTLMMARAAQKYGIVVRDTSGVVCFYGQDPVPSGHDAYFAANGIFRGVTPSRLLASFPWSHLQVLRLALR